MPVSFNQRHFLSEIYFVIIGSGEYVCGDSRQRFGPTDILFAVAGVEHRFENFQMTRPFGFCSMGPRAANPMENEEWHTFARLRPASL